MIKALNDIVGTREVFDTAPAICDFFFLPLSFFLSFYQKGRVGIPGACM